MACFPQSNPGEIGQNGEGALLRSLHFDAETDRVTGLTGLHKSSRILSDLQEQEEKAAEQRGEGEAKEKQEAEAKIRTAIDPTRKSL